MSGRRILVPVDGSSHSRRATEYALKIARCMDCEILLIHCHKHFPILSGEPYYQKAVSKIMFEANELLESFRQMISKAGINFEALILEGHPGVKICEAAAVRQCEMIVMGSRGRTELQELILGSVARRVLHSSECPVLVVK